MSDGMRSTMREPQSVIINIFCVINRTRSLGCPPPPRIISPIGAILLGVPVTDSHICVLSLA